MEAKAEVQSPFLPGTKIQYAWDSTTLGALKTCPRLYQYLYIDGWSSRDESVHLRFGQEFHQALQDYDLSRAAGIAHDESVFDVVRDLLLRTPDFAPDPDTKAGKYKSRKALVRSVIDYLDEHRDDPAETYIKADGTPAVELSFRFELDWGPSQQPGLQLVETVEVEPETKGGINYGSHEVHMKFPPVQPYLLCGHLDKVVTFADALFVKDYKTTTSTPGTYWFDQWSPSNQMTLYSLAAKVILDAPIKGVIIDAVQLLVAETRFVRGFTYRTPDQLEEWLVDLRYWLNLAESYALADYWPQNDTACDKFGGCRFRDVCSKSPGVRRQFLKSDFTQLPPEDRWNPLKSRS